MVVITQLPWMCCQEGAFLCKMWLLCMMLLARFLAAKSSHYYYLVVRVVQLAAPGISLMEGDSAGHIMHILEPFKLPECKHHEIGM